MATNNNTSAQTMTPVIFSSTVGTAIEWYDFFLYGTMATLVFPKVFFPESNPLVGTLLSFVTFLVRFIARPIGGVVVSCRVDPHRRQSVPRIQPPRHSLADARPRRL